MLLCYLLDPAARTAVTPRRTENVPPSTRGQNVDIVRIRGAEEGIGIQKITEDQEAAIRGIEIRDVIMQARADRTPRIV